MTQYLSQQSLLSLLLSAVLLGILLGAVYQVFLIRRAGFRQLKIPRIFSVVLQNAEEFLFCIGAGAAVSVLYFACSNGVVRLMAIPAMAGGFFLWRMTLGRVVNACTDAILRALAAICRWIRKRIFAPLGRLVRRIIDAISARIAIRRKKRRAKRLCKIAKKETRIYRAALLRAAGRGSLPLAGKRK